MKPTEELTFEEYWERYANPRHVQNKDAKDAARNAWIVCRNQEKRLQIIEQAQAEKKTKSKQSSCPHTNTIDQGPDGVLCTDCGETTCP